MRNKVRWVSVKRSFSGSLLCIQERGPTLQHPFLIDSWVKMVTCSLHDHSVHNQPSCVPPTTSCWAVTYYCLGLHEAPCIIVQLIDYHSKTYLWELTEESHFKQCEQSIWLFFKISVYLGDGMNYTLIFSAKTQPNLRDCWHAGCLLCMCPNSTARHALVKCQQPFYFSYSMTDLYTRDLLSGYSWLSEETDQFGYRCVIQMQIMKNNVFHVNAMP